ncbi:hypothetical protein A1O3_05366 [Capronia epimyces CBS 606.96]|uniref:Uncharacterized protein n=1 Tax=Capronia epimyces CBS 606.96 TaxID=1182542 RepID=W9Y643_9EURO|nr:uncharacterized protein A1O3_05366 [Capronia epimyces CBS 606.96]EXJ84696.1 hypothetical protein A1O3_05366 [Capronia epimyces CBS 606.96]
MAYSRRSSGSEAEYVLMPVRSHAGSDYGRSRRGRSPEEVVVNNFLGVPGQGGRPRASSQGGGPAPTIVNIGGLPTTAAGDHGTRSRSRHRHHRSRSSSSSSYSSRSRSRSRHRRGRESKSSRRPLYEDDRIRKPRELDEADLPYHVRRDLDYARIQRKEEEERRIQDRIKHDRELEKRRWKLEEEEENLRRKKEREAVLLEAKLEEERKKKEAEDLRKKILKDEEERVKKEKEKKKAEEEEFERKVKEKFMKAGYSSEYIEEVLHKKKAEQATLAIDLQRPTYIKVNRKYLHPDTLDAYGLPWEWDGRDDEYIIIKKYIDNTLQDELFEHTRRLKERKLITGPYVKETKVITKLSPNEYVKKGGDKMYVVREKSKSPARSRRGSWMFT